MELLTVVAIIGVMAGVAISSGIEWLPKHRLKSATNDLFSNMQRARMMAIKENSNWIIVFDRGAMHGYRVWSYGPNKTWENGASTDVLDRTVNLADYGSGVDFGHGNATDDIPLGNNAIGDDVSYNPDRVIFNPVGTGTAGYVYLENNQDDTYGVGTRSSGVIRSLRWSGTWN
jgi:Tfp pilus assembly protein FimT